MSAILTMKQILLFGGRLKKTTLYLQMIGKQSNTKMNCADI